MTNQPTAPPALPDTLAELPGEPGFIDNVIAQVDAEEVELKMLRDFHNEVSAAVASEDAGNIEHLIATSSLGKHTTLIGRRAYELLKQRSENITGDEARELQDILRTLTDSGTALKTSARELVAAFERHRKRADTAEAKVAELTAANEQLKLRLLSAAGDDLCRLSQEEIKAYTSGEVQIPPKEEFIPSCERFWDQTAARVGVLKGCFTLAQLISENEKLLPKVIVGDGHTPLPKHHHIAENIPDAEFGLPYSNFVSVGELSIQGRIYLDYGIPQFPDRPTNTNQKGE